MVSRTRIPTSMYPSDYTPSTPSGVVTPASMIKSGSGERITEEMIQDYPCGDEPGHGFRSSPLNIYALARDSSVVLYVEKGCANFTWESDNEWATFGSAETAVRYNTLASSADEGQDTVVTVTDTNGLEVTINVPYMDASTCCEDPPALSFQTAIREVIEELNTCEVVLFIDGGCPPFAWTVEVDDEGSATLENEATNSRRNRIAGTSTCFTVTVTDSCSQEASIGITPLSEFDNYEYDETFSGYPYAVQLSTDYYAIVYNDSSLDGWIKTFNIPSTTGVITEVDSYKYSTADGQYPMIINVTGDIFAITDKSGYIYTVEISEAGVITKTLKDSHQIDASATRNNNPIVYVSDGIYAVFWAASIGRRVATFGITDEGAISTIDSWACAVSNNPVSAFKVASGVYAVVFLYDYRRFGVDTFEISNDGTITEAILDFVLVTIDTADTGISHGPTQVLEVGSNVFAVAHSGSVDYGKTIATFGIANDGTVTTSTIDELGCFAESGSGNPNASVRLAYSGSGNIYYVVYAGSDGDGYVRSVSITSTGIITDDSPCGGYEFDNLNLANYPHVLPPQGSMLPIFYPGFSTDGWVRTINLGE